MAIAHAEQFLTTVPGSTAAGNYDLSCAATVTPNAACVGIVYNSVSDLVTSVSYGIAGGAVALARRRFDTEATEAGAVLLYWAAGTFPSGTQTVRVVRTGTTNMRFVVWTMTVTDPATFTVTVDSDATGTSASVANPSWTHTSLVNDVVAYLAIHSGLTSMTNTPAAGWTLADSEDYGAQGRGWARRTLATAGALAPGWTAATADDFRGSSIAFKEIPIQLAGHVHPIVAGRQVTPARDVPTIL